MRYLLDSTTNEEKQLDRPSAWNLFALSVFRESERWETSVLNVFVNIPLDWVETLRSSYSACVVGAGRWNPDSNGSHTNTHEDATRPAKITVRALLSVLKSLFRTPKITLRVPKSTKLARSTGMRLISDKYLHSSPIAVHSLTECYSGFLSSGAYSVQTTNCYARWHDQLFPNVMPSRFTKISSLTTANKDTLMVFGSLPPNGRMEFSLMKVGVKSYSRQSLALVLE